MPYTENSNVKAWKRKLLKVDELVLPVSKVEPLRSRKRKGNRKKKQEGNQNDSSSDSDVEPEKSLPLIAEKSKPQTVQLFDLWETKGSNQKIIVLHDICKSYLCAVCVFCRCVNDFTTTFTHCLATDFILFCVTELLSVDSQVFLNIVSLNSHVKWSVTELMMSQLTFSSGFQTMKLQLPAEI